MKTYTLSLTKRDVGRAGRKLRTADDIYGVVYGHGLDPVAVKAQRRELIKLLAEAGTSHIIKLTIDQTDPIDVLVKDLDHEPVSNQIRHFDLQAIKKGEKITVEIPVELVGESPAAKIGLVVHQLIDTIEVSTVPDKIPEAFKVDITHLSEVGDSIAVGDLTLDSEVEIEDTLLEQPIVKVDEVKEMEIEDTTPEVSADDVESEQGGEGDEAAGAEGEGEGEAPAEKADQDT